MILKRFPGRFVNLSFLNLWQLFTDAGQYVIRFGCADSHTNRGAHVNVRTDEC